MSNITSRTFSFLFVFLLFLLDISMISSFSLKSSKASLCRKYHTNPINMAGFGVKKEAVEVEGKPITKVADVTAQCKCLILYI